MTLASSTAVKSSAGEGATANGSFDVQVGAAFAPISETTRENMGTSAQPPNPAPLLTGAVASAG